VRTNVGTLVCALNLGTELINVGVLVHALNFGVARKNVGVWMCMLNLALRSVHTHKMCARCAHTIIMVRVVCAVLAECRGVWLVHAQ
jgi:hypothetical protein